MKRRTFIQTPAALIGAGALSLPVLAQEPFPNKPIRFVIPSAPAGVSDAVARAYGRRY